MSIVPAAQVDKSVGYESFRLGMKNHEMSVYMPLQSVSTVMALKIALAFYVDRMADIRQRQIQTCESTRLSPVVD